MSKLKIELNAHKTYGTDYQSIILGSFSYTPPAVAIKHINKILKSYNELIIEKEKSKKNIIKIAQIITEDYKATIILKGKHKVLSAFADSLFENSTLLEHFDIKFKKGIL